MLVGEPPYMGKTPQAVLGMIITGGIKSVSGQRRSVPLNVDGAIAKAVEKLPADRVGSAKELAKAGWFGPEQGPGEMACRLGRTLSQCATSHTAERPLSSQGSP
jgi:hypothetical protein